MRGPVDVARLVLDVLRTGDAEVAAQILAPEAVLWHNDGSGEINARDGLEMAGGLHALVDDVDVEEILAGSTETGAFIRYQVVGRVKSSGGQLRAHNCIFVTVEDAQLTRIDEYFDPTFAAHLGL